MFELFKRAKSEVMVAAGLQKTEAEIIAEIHGAFDGAEDYLLKEAERILAMPIGGTDTRIIQKAERLEKLGFKQSPEVTKASAARESIATAKRQKEMNNALAELIRYYKQAYPFLKFLTIEEMESICEKYGLVHAPVSAYRGNVPDKNLLEIERAQELKACDIQIPMVKFVVEGRSRSVEPTKAFLKQLGLDDFVTIEKIRAVAGFDKWDENYYLSGMNKLVSNMWLYKVWERMGKKDGTHYDYTQVQQQDRTGLFICAPKKDFDVTGLTKQGLGYSKDQFIDVRDPVVFRYVRGGVQVLSKWGLEASDPALLNEIDN
jgi:hypothetical protein